MDPMPEVHYHESVLTSTGDGGLRALDGLEAGLLKKLRSPPSGGR